jgi:hypothetical protein
VGTLIAFQLTYLTSMKCGQQSKASELAHKLPPKRPLG